MQGTEGEITALQPSNTCDGVLALPLLMQQSTYEEQQMVQALGPLQFQVPGLCLTQPWPFTE